MMYKNLLFLKKYLIIFFGLLLFIHTLEAKLPELEPKDVTKKANEIMKSHASYKKLNPELVKRTLSNFAEELDPTKTYFVESDIDRWIHPSDDLVDKILKEYEHGNFQEFEKMLSAIRPAIQRRHELDKEVDELTMPAHVQMIEFKNLKWANNKEELLNRLTQIKALQVEAASKLKPEIKATSFQRIAKRQAKYEEDLLTDDPIKRQKLLLSNILKATASSLDSHTVYFTPDEANQFMISVQQRLFGIGAQLRDDISGFSVVKIVEGGPAFRGKQLKVKDRIIAVNGEPVVGMDITDAVELIRGEENTKVALTVVRENSEEGEVKEHTLEVPVIRGEVVLNESRFESSYEPFGDGVIAYLKLHSFYQDQNSSSTSDILQALEKLKKEHKVLGVILDLRSNPGGILAQAVSVAGLFITKGIVVGIKDESGKIQYLRDLDGTVAWDGSLIVLINRLSASASEIVAQTLQDYGKALVIGDDRSFGKGSFQTFTLNTDKNLSVNPQGEYKVTRGRYYTVSGKSPQLVGVGSQIKVPGPLSESEIGEQYAKYPLSTDQIPENYHDDLSDVSIFQRDKVASLYRFNLQQKQDLYGPYLPALQKNSQERIQNNKDYQTFLKELKKKGKEVEEDNPEAFGQNDLQLNEAFNIMKDLILLKMLLESVPAA